MHPAIIVIKESQTNKANTFFNQFDFSPYLTMWILSFAIKYIGNNIKDTNR